MGPSHPHRLTGAAIQKSGSRLGSITYDGFVIQIDDRTLAHLQIVIVNKLRRGDGFLMSWKDAPAVGDGRSGIWLDRTIPLHFKFDGSRVPNINQAWLVELTASADSSRGLIVTKETGDLSVLQDDGIRKGGPLPTVVAPVVHDRGTEPAAAK
jgi:hypothetical protein